MRWAQGKESYLVAEVTNLTGVVLVCRLLAEDSDVPLG
jgi:hypothetical protein